jgi:prophage regulatory protein
VIWLPKDFDMRGDSEVSGSEATLSAATANSSEIAAIRILRLPEVCQVTGLKRAMIYRLQQRKRFPQSVKITDHAVGWIDAEIQAWLQRRAAGRQRTWRENEHL